MDPTEPRAKPLALKYRLLLAILIVVPLIIPPLAGLGWLAYQRHEARKRLRPRFGISLVTPIDDPAAREAALTALEAAVTRRLDAQTKAPRHVALEGTSCTVALDPLTPEDDVARLQGVLSQEGGTLELRLVRQDPAASGVDALERETGQKLRLEATVIVDQRHVQEVSLTTQPTSGSPAVSIRLTPEGGERMYACTSQSLGRQLAIVHDGVILMAPTIQSGVRDEITLTLGSRASEAEARRIALALDPRCRYPAPVRVVIVGM